MSVDVLRAFRRNAVHVRLALHVGAGPGGPREMRDGQLQDQMRFARFRNLAIPVRRALNPTDRVSFIAALEAGRVAAALGQHPTHALDDADRRWTTLQHELDSTAAFGQCRVARRELMTDFLSAATTYDPVDPDVAFRNYIDERGSAAESLVVQLLEDAAHVIIALDGALAALLGEPAILPPPRKTPPPPPDPNQPFWKSLLTLTRHES
jgi:hypothetical protein